MQDTRGEQDGPMSDLLLTSSYSYRLTTLAMSNNNSHSQCCYTNYHYFDNFVATIGRFAQMIIRKVGLVHGFQRAPFISGRV